MQTEKINSMSNSDYAKMSGLGANHFLRVFKKGYPDFIQKLCRCSDKYSYDVYLVHQFVIFGPFSLMKCTGILAVNVVLVIVTIVACAVVVNFVSGLIKNRIKVAGKK